MSSRRKFLKMSAASAALLSLDKSVLGKNSLNNMDGEKPLVLSTWKHGLEANKTAWKILSTEGNALDAVQNGVMITESDHNNRSVGLWALPDRDGHVTLDACIMDDKGNCGSVCFLEHIEHPISVARLVMEKTPHIILSGEGAQKFALDNGFKLEKFDRSEKSDKEWKEWLKTAQYKPIINFENHDTIGMIAIDSKGNLSGACTTSGLAWKMHGRVGDSPIIGAGLFVDNEVGAAVATGTGEEVIRICGTHTVVEMMRAGHSPKEACRIAIERISKSPKNVKEIQVGFLAINKHGEYGAFSLTKGFDYALYSGKVKNDLKMSESFWG